MKKSNFFKTVLGVAAAMLISSGVFGQNPASPYVLYDANQTVPTTIDFVTIKTGGTTMGYYALPDPAYHPNYVASNTLTADFTWTWTVDNSGVLAYPAAFTDNYAQITYPAVGNYVVTVAENAPAAFGGCAGATTTMNVTGIAPPTAQFTSADSTSNCGTLVSQNVVVTLTENSTNAFAAFAFRVRLTVANLDGSGSVVGAPVVTAPYDFLALTPNSKAKTGTPGFSVAGAPNYTFTFATGALVNVAGYTRTRYTYELLNASDVATGTGLVSAISQKSDFLTTLNTYAFGATNRVDFYINPAPVTGPIYYVPNTYAY